MKLMKKVCSVMLVSAMAMGLGGCGSSSNQSTSSNSNQTSSNQTTTTTDTSAADSSTSIADSTEPVTIRFSWWGGESRHSATEAAVAAFMEKYPHITVEIEYGAWDGWTEKCATQLNAGTAPDLMQVNWNWVYQFSANGSKFVDLNTMSDIVNLSNYPSNLLDLCVVGGQQQSVPVGTTGKCFFWNQSTFEKAGLDLPETIDDLINAGAVFRDTLGENYYPMAMYQYERMIFMLYYLEAKYGMNWVENGELNYSYDQVKEGLDWICSLEEAHVLPRISTLLGDGATTLDKNSKWANGTYAGIYEWDSANKKLIEALEPGQEFALGNFLTGIGSYDAGLTKVSLCLAVTESSKNKEAAALLLDFLVNDPEGIELMGTERGMLANNYANSVLEEKNVFEGNLTYDANQAVLSVANFSFDPNFEHSELKDSTGVYYEVFENISADHSTTGEMAQYLIDEVERVLAENAY